MKYDILNRFNGAVQFTAEIDCAVATPVGVKIGLAVKWGFAAKANLDGANLDGASLYGANLDRASLYGASLKRANLDLANLDGASLDGASLKGANLDLASLKGANLDRANLDGASLKGASLYGASLDRASLYGASLKRASLYGASLYGARGIVSFGPVGCERHIGFAVCHDKIAMVQLGCFWGSEEKAIAAIIEKYGAGSTYEALVRAACRVVLDDGP